jgi:hypothetical protein
VHACKEWQTERNVASKNGHKFSISQILAWDNERIHAALKVQTIADKEKEQRFLLQLTHVFKE